MPWSSWVNFPRRPPIQIHCTVLRHGAGFGILGAMVSLRIWHVCPTPFVFPVIGSFIFASIVVVVECGQVCYHTWAEKGGGGHAYPEGKGVG